MTTLENYSSKRDVGATLVEVILAVSLTGLIILFLLGLLPSIGLLGQKAEHQVTASHFAQELMVEANSRDFDTLKASAGTLTVTNPGVFSTELQPRVAEDGTNFVPQIVIESLPPEDYLLQVTVTIRWKVRDVERDFVLRRRRSAVLR